MDVGTVANATAGVNQYMSQSKNVSSANASNAYSAMNQTSSNSTDVGEAYSVDISDAAKQAAANSEDTAVDSSTEKTKGLSAEQVRYLEDSIQISQQTMLNMMIQALQDSNDKLQSWADEGVGILNFDGVQIDASRFALPEVATNPEDAAKAVSDEGDWGVDAVATRIFDLATAIAGNDPEKLSTMRSAVEEGFKQAGIAWNNATGMDKMPEITEKTYNEIMSRFDKRAEEISASAPQAAAVSVVAN